MARLRIRAAVTMAALGATLVLGLPAGAQMEMGGGHMEGMMGGGRMGGMMGEQCPKCPMEEPPGWLATMTKEQKARMDNMHLILGKEMSMLDARLELKEAELKNLVMQDAPDKKAVSKKIDEIIELKKEMMTKKYDHVMELRGILTPEQKMAFDMKFFHWMRYMGMDGGRGCMGGGMH